MGIDANTLATSLKEGAQSGLLKIIAPIKGVLSFFEIASGELIAADRPIFRIIDLSTVLVSADVPESEIPLVYIGKKLHVKATGVKGTFTATINMMASHVNPSTRTLTVRARLDNPNSILKPGMFVEVSLEDKGNLVLCVPKSAIQSVNERNVTFARSPHGYEQLVITTGREYADYVEILTGLVEGEEVATQGSLMLKAELSSKYND